MSRADISKVIHVLNEVRWRDDLVYWCSDYFRTSLLNGRHVNLINFLLVLRIAGATRTESVFTEGVLFLVWQRIKLIII